MLINTKTTLEGWKRALATILRHGSDFVDENKRVCRELLNLTVEVDKPEQDIARPIHVLNSFQYWEYPPLEEIAQVMLLHKLAPDYSYSYGPRAFNFQNRTNQIRQFLIPLLKELPNSRRAVVSFWDPVEDSNILKRDVPGLVMLDFKLRNNRLNITAVVRSNDMFFGWPANVYQIYTMQDYVRKHLGCKLGHLATFSTSAHIFQDQFQYIRKVLKKE